MNCEKRFLCIFSFLWVSISFASESQPQHLKESSFNVCGRKLKLEVAKTESERSIGMMHRQGVPDGNGMIFIFENERELNFWMRNVSFDLDIAFFDKNGAFINSYTMNGTSPLIQDAALPNYKSHKKAKYAVEVTAGFYASLPGLARCRLSPLPSN